MVSRHVLEGDIRCCRQADLIERMQEKGLDTTQAETLLDLFQSCLDMSHAHLRRLTKTNTLAGRSQPGLGHQL